MTTAWRCRRAGPRQSWYKLRGSKAGTKAGSARVRAAALPAVDRYALRVTCAPRFVMQWLVRLQDGRGHEPGSGGSSDGGGPGGACARLRHRDHGQSE
jgi:hypothetical protein